MTNKEYANDRVLMIGSLLHCWLMLPTTSIRCHFFTAKKVLIFFLFLNENIHCGYSLEAPHWGTSNEYLQCMFSSRQALLMSTHNVCFCWDWGTSNEYPQCMFPLRNKKYILHLKPAFVWSYAYYWPQNLYLSSYPFCLVLWIIEIDSNLVLPVKTVSIITELQLRGDGLIRLLWQKHGKEAFMDM